MPDLLESPHLKLPYLAAAQAQKHVTHNEALKRLDTLVQLAVLDAALETPPGTPAAGDRYIVAAEATGDWEDHDGDIATFIDGAWDFATPEAGWLAYDVAGEVLLVHAAGAWYAVGRYLGVIDKLGVNATPDDTNRLAVRAAAVLFSAVAAGDGGTGDIRFVIDKEADGDTASLLFQSGWSGRAEVGLAGDTDFVFKVSPDGASWIEAIRIDKDTGLADILYDNSVSGLAAASVQDAIDEVAASGGGGAVASVFGRTGAVAAAAGDYDAGEVGNDSSVSGASVKDALNALGTGIAGKQDADSDLTALAGVAAAGLLARTDAGTAAARMLTAGAGIAITNGDGVAGNPTIAGSTATTAAYGDVKLGTEVREKLAANRTYYVRTDGSDANTGLANSAGGAFLTIQKAVDVVVQTLDVAGFTVTIQVGDGTYAGGVTISEWVGGGAIAVQGNTGNMDAVIISAAAAFQNASTFTGTLVVSYVKMTGAQSFVLSYGGTLRFHHVNVAGAGGYQIMIDHPGAVVIVDGNYTISSGAAIHVLCRFGLFYVPGIVTVTVSGTPAFSIAFMYAEHKSTVQMSSVTYSGSATGTRYFAGELSLLNTGGAGASFFPGNAAGSTASGAQYV